MKSRAREQASSSIPLRGRHERGAEKNGKQMRSQVASRSENHDGKQQDMTTHEQNAKSDRQTRPEPAHNSHKSKTNDTPRPPRVRPRGQERERKKWSIWYYVVQFSSDKTPYTDQPNNQNREATQRAFEVNLKPGFWISAYDPTGPRKAGATGPSLLGE